jgi:hypothetical protein
MYIMAACISHQESSQRSSVSFERSRIGFQQAVLADGWWLIANNCFSRWTVSSLSACSGGVCQGDIA